MNLTYFLIANEFEKVVIKEDENSGVKWFDLDEVLNIIDEPRMRPIYKKLFNLIIGLRKSIR